MPSLPRPRTSLRSMGISAAVGLALTVPMGTAMAADAPSEDSLCSAISFDQLHELGPLRFEAVLFDSPELCAYGPSPTGGTPQLSFLILGLSLDFMEPEFTDPIETMVGGRRALTADGGLHVDVDGRILSFTLDLGDEAEPAVDALEYSMIVAEIVVPAVMGGSASSQTAAADDGQLRVPEVEGIEWGGIQDVMTAEEMIAGDEMQAALWQPIFDATGAEPKDLVTLNVRAFKAGTTDELGFYGALRIEGADENALRAGFIDFLGNVGGDVVIEDISLGGRDVQRMAAGDAISGVMYVDGDTVHTFTMSDEDAARVIEALP